MVYAEGLGPPFGWWAIGGNRVELGPLSADDKRVKEGRGVLFGDEPFKVWFDDVGVGDLEEAGLS